MAAFSALIVSPVGALPPRATDNGTSLPDRTTLSFDYGRWRYDIDDAIHHNLGAAVTERLGSTRTQLSLTGAYLALACECSGWASGGVSISSQLWSNALPRAEPARRTMHVAVDLAAGGARYLGPGAATGFSAAGELEVGGSTSFVGGSRLALSIVPGFGVGHLNSADATATGERPLVGFAAAWTLRNGVAIDIGAERVALQGGPVQFGAGLSWHRR